jgi:hypothetical protein
MLFFCVGEHFRGGYCYEGGGVKSKLDLYTVDKASTMKYVSYTIQFNTQYLSPKKKNYSKNNGYALTLVGG